jgi:amino acid transporter
MEEHKPELSFRFKWGFWYGAWAVTALCLLPGVLFFPAFPAGLFEFFGVKQNAQSNSHLQFFIGWLPYVVLTIGAYLTKRKSTYFIIYAVFCILLVMNVIGCRAVLRELDRGLH